MFLTCSSEAPEVRRRQIRAGFFVLTPQVLITQVKSWFYTQNQLLSASLTAEIYYRKVKSSLL